MKQIFSFLFNLKRRHPLILLHLVLQIGISIVLMAVPEVLRLATGAISTGEVQSLNRAVVLAISATVMYIIFTAIDKPLEVHVKNKCEQDVQNEVVQKALLLKRQQLSKFSSGDIITKTTQNATEAVNRSLSVVFGIFSGICLTLASVVYMGLTSLRMTLIVVPYFVVLKIFVDWIYGKLNKKSKQNVTKTKLGNAFLIDVLNNLTVIRAFSKREFFSKKLANNENELAKINIAMHILYWCAFYVLLAFTKIAEFGIVYGIAGYWVYVGILDFGVIAAFAVAIDRFEKGMRPLVGGIANIATSLPHIENITSFLGNDEGCENETDILPSGDSSIVFENVNFSFGDKSIFDKFNLSISPGEKIVVRGENGKGKSTMLRLMSGIYRPDSGRILIGGHNIRKTSIDSIVQKICFISQSSDILEGNVLENLALNENYDKELCYLLLDTLNMPHVSDYLPQNLSQGEKQRLNIGRTLYKYQHMKSADIILGDEIFSNVDSKNKEVIAAAFFKIFADKTVVLICHDDIPYEFDRELIL